MERISRCKAFFCVALTLACWDHSTVVFAEDVQAQAEQESTEQESIEEQGWISDGSSLDVDWWTKNPLKITPLPSPILYHAELSYRYTGTTGNVELEDHSLGGNLFFRKQLVTSETLFKVSEQKIAIMLFPGDALSEVKSHKLAQEFSWAVTETASIIAGGGWTQNDSTRYIKLGQVYYGGVHYQPIDADNFSFGASLSAGYLKTSYLNEDIQALYDDFQAVDDFQSSALNLNVDFSWKIRDDVTLSEGVNYLLSLDNTRYYSWGSNTRVDVALWEKVSFFTEFNMSFLHSPLIEKVLEYLSDKRKAGEEVGSMEELDTTLSAGVRVTF